MISYGSGLPGGIFLPILTLGSLLGLFVARFFLDIGFISQDQMLLFIVLGMAGFFSAISKAPLTAIILVTEMVGSLNQLMVIGLVVLITSQIHHGKSRIVKGNSQLFMGDSLLVAVPISQIHAVHKIFEGD